MHHTVSPQRRLKIGEWEMGVLVPQVPANRASGWQWLCSSTEGHSSCGAPSLQLSSDSGEWVPHSGYLHYPVPFSEPCLYLQGYAFIKLLVNRPCPNVPYLPQGDPDQYRTLENRLRKSFCSCLGKGTR